LSEELLYQGIDNGRNKKWVAFWATRFFL